MRRSILYILFILFAPVVRAQSFLYVQSLGDTLTAIPADYVSDYDLETGEAHIRLITGKVLVVSGAKHIMQECPAELPRFAYYRFNSKQNDQLFQSVAASPSELIRDTVRLNVAQIGKSLTATFGFTDEEAKAWVGSVQQKSNVTRQRMAEPVTYTIGHNTWRQLQIQEKEADETTYRYIPFGRRVTVCADFLTDYPNNIYNVPRIDITTATGSVPLSKSDYISATIAIDGSGVFPDMPTTDILIKGRGNTSWSGSSKSKNPYHFKFAEKQKPLGMKAGKHWILLGNKQKESMLCNAMAQKASALAGCASVCHIVPVELYINGSYRGSYNLTEKVGFYNNSVSLDDETCAAMLELDTYKDEPIWRDNVYNIATKIHDPDFDNEDSLRLITQDDAIADWNSATETLRYGADDDYTGRFDVNYLVSYLFANELCYNSELQHPKSVFLYSENVLDDGFKLTGIDETPWVFGPMWDCDWAFGYQFGNSSYFLNCAEAEYYDDWLDATMVNGFWHNLRYKSQTVDKAYYTLWHQFMNDGRMQELIDYVQDYYEYAAPSLSHNSSSDTNERDGSNYATIASRAASWFRRRANYVYASLTVYDIEEEPQEDMPTPLILDTDDSIMQLARRDMEEPAFIYDISGRCMVNGKLPGGIYIRPDGRKVLLKP